MFDLTKKQLSGDTSAVPIGNTIITNNPTESSKVVQSVVTGLKTKPLDVKNFGAQGYSEAQVVRNISENELEFLPPEDPNILRSVDWAFDDSTGTLTFIRRDMEVVKIPYFLRQIDFGVGPQGPRGARGRDGINGEDGKDGETGDIGCAGPRGADGRAGDVGSRGVEGPIGPEGPIGRQGQRGERGPIGEVGLSGFEGIRGKCGPSCPSTLVGPKGPTGPINSIFVCTEKSPKSDSLIWAAPNDCLNPLNPKYIKWVNVPKPVIRSQREMPVPDLVCGAGTTIHGVWKGPTTAAGTRIEYLWSDGTTTYSEPDYKGAFCAIAVKPPPVVKCMWQKDVFHVYKTRRRKKNDNYPRYDFVLNGQVIYSTHVSSKNGVFEFKEANPVVVDGKRYWMGAVMEGYHTGDRYHIYNELCGEFEQD